MSRATTQIPLFPYADVTRVVNIASIPQRSPFRYPGGKTWLVPHVRKWLASLPTKPVTLIEPFAGGAIVSLTAVCEGLVSHAIMVELDDDVAAVWQTILGDDGDWLAERISTFQLSCESAREVLSDDKPDLKTRAFQTILRNRINHGGILAPGSGVTKSGENGKGITSRWYPETLKYRIHEIIKVKDKITFVHGDGLAILADYRHDADAVFFIDPPYTAGGKKAGSRLYTHHQLDHDELFFRTRLLTGDFLMTYDVADDVIKLAQEYSFSVKPIPMKNTHNNTMDELLVGRDLCWVY